MTTPVDAEGLTREMVDRIVDRYRPLRIIIFGSRGRGDAGSDSDVDLLVVMPDGSDRREAAIAIGAALADVSLAKDIIVTTPGEIADRGHVVNTVLRSALREGREPTYWSDGQREAAERGALLRAYATCGGKGN